MDHVGAMADDPAFRWTDRVILDLHFDACYFQKDKEPGRYRRGGIEVTSPGGGRPASVAQPADDVPTLMNEAVDWLERGDLDLPVVMRAAMAHLHVVSVHPFRYGDGRIARIVQSLVLARECPLAPEFVSHRGVPRPWVRFCIQAHLDQARRRLDQISDAERRWSVLAEEVGRRGWPNRLVIALEQSFFQGMDRASYGAEADVSAPTASNDLRRLVDAGMVVQQGKGRTTRYVAGETLRRTLQATTRD